MTFRIRAASAALLLALPAGTAVADHCSCCGCGHRASASYATVARPVVVRPAYSQVVTSPAVYGMRTERVLVSPGRTRAEHIPAVVGTRTERVVVSPARVVYEPRVIPAVYGSVTRQVVLRPASVRYVTEPAVYQNVARRVVVQPAASRVIEQPAVMGYRQERVVVGYSNGGGTRRDHGWGRSEVPLWGYGAPRYHHGRSHGGWHHR
jgi:hypothetical protein